MEIPIGKNIRRLRRKKEMTQADLALRLGVSVQAVSKWERECSYPDIALLLPIAEVFDTTLDEIFGRLDAKRS